LNVTDLYGYDFIVTGSDWSTYFELQSFKFKEFQDAIWGVGNWFSVYPALDYDLSKPYRQAVSAKKPATGAPKGNYKLAELTFHIKNDWCWCCGNHDGWFYFTYGVLSDSCSSPIKYCDTLNAFYTLKPVQPLIYLTPKYEENCKVGDTFKMKVMIQNVVKMNSLHFVLRWFGNWVYDYESHDWVCIQILCTTEEKIVVNNALFPEDKIDTKTITVTPYGGPSPYYYMTEIAFDLHMKSSYPLINVTAATWAVEIEFTKQDPWWCGRQPTYSPSPPHEYVADNASTLIIFQQGYIDGKCPDDYKLWFGEYFYANRITTTWPENLTGVHSLRTTQDFADPEGKFTPWSYVCMMKFANAEFEFDPVEGDLNGDGEVNVADLNIMAQYYDHGWDYVPPGAYSTSRGYYYDLNKSGWIDIYDLVIVAKHFGDKCAGHSIS
jgi:hypothetical protein